MEMEMENMENIYKNTTYLLVVVVMEMEMEKMENIYRNFTYQLVVVVEKK